MDGYAILIDSVFVSFCWFFGNYPRLLIGRPIAIMYFLARKIMLSGNSSCKHFFTLSEDSVRSGKIKPQRAQSTQRVVIFLFLPLCALRVLCGFPKPYFENIKKYPIFWSLQHEITQASTTESLPKTQK